MGDPATDGVMRLKTYRAANMADALVLVKKDLGKDAVILHTRVFKVGAIFGFGGKQQVEVTASVGVNAPARGTSAPAPAVSSTSAMNTAAPARNAVARAYGAAGAPAAASVGVSAAQPATSIIEPKRAIGSSPVAPEAVRDVAQIAVAAAAPVPVAAPHPRGSSTISDDMHAELAAIKRMVGQVLQGTGASRVGAARDDREASTTLVGGLPMPPALLDQYVRLIEAEVSREVADDLIGSLRDELTPTELKDGQAVRVALLRKLESFFPTSGAPMPAPRSGRACTIALIGPTGVGKTTTVAKLAAAHKLRHGRKVGLITCDTYRIAAVEQLRTYANIIGVPLKVVLTPGELREACAELNSCDVILIDTAGRSPGDGARLDELRAFLHAAEPDQTHLVLSSTAGASSLHRAAEKFAALKPDHLLLTKLDEAVNFGLVVDITRRVSRELDVRLSYVTTGQEVPDDIEPARADRMARLVLEGALPA
jgi:flagellar biosynthesis protein FlhF